MAGKVAAVVTSRTAVWLRVLGLILALGASGCRCGDSTLGGVEVGFRADGSPIDFGRALAGAQVTRALLLTSTGKVALSIEASTEGPFSVPPAFTLEGATTFSLSITFTAAVGRSEGRLWLRANGKSVSLPLLGEGIEALDCQPSAVCRTSRFELESGRCVETVAADGAPCTPVSQCLEHGLCQAGECLGSPRGCDDNNRCTADACAPENGCLHTEVACPSPAQACRVPSCDPMSGCGDAPALDGTPCGPADCVHAQLCFAGSCRTVPTPDGFLCLPPTPCQGEGRCQSQQCVQPPIAAMVPAYTLPLPGAAEPAPLLTSNGNLFWEACALAGTDGGCALSSYTGSGFQRFYVPHPSGKVRSLVTASSAGVVLLSADGLEAYAPGTGGPLWTLPFSTLVPPAEATGATAETTRNRIALSASGELLATLSWRPEGDAGPSLDAGLPVDGGNLGDGGSLPDSGTPGDAGASDGGALDVDGGTSMAPPLLSGLQTLLRISADGGVLSQQPLRGEGTESAVALDTHSVGYLYDGTGALVRVERGDGGERLQSLGSWPSAASSLAVAQGKLVLGGRWLVDSDAGTARGELRWIDDAGQPVVLEPGSVLLTGGLGYGFAPGCDLAEGPCDLGDPGTTLHAFSLADAGPVWAARVLPGKALGRLARAAVVSLGPGAVATLTEAQLDGGPQSHLQLFAGGTRLFVCPLKPGGTLKSAAFDRGFLYVVVERGGVGSLEAYDLAGLPLETAGWPQAEGAAGARREGR